MTKTQVEVITSVQRRRRSPLPSVGRMLAGSSSNWRILPPMPGAARRRQRSPQSRSKPSGAGWLGCAGRRVCLRGKAKGFELAQRTAIPSSILTGVFDAYPSLSAVARAISRTLSIGGRTSTWF
jgi:hypothetical protein